MRTNVSLEHQERMLAHLEKQVRTVAQSFEKVRAGFYRCGAYCIHGSRNRWSIYLREKYIKSFATLNAARFWAHKNPAAE